MVISGREKCGLPRDTRSIGWFGVLFSLFQHMARSFSLMSIEGTFCLSLPMASLSVVASGVIPTRWNIGALDTVANAAPNAFKPSLLGLNDCIPTTTGI